MKYRLALALVLLLPLSVLARAEGAPPAPEQDTHRGPPSAEQMSERLVRQLGLDDKQASAVLKINQRHVAQMKELQQRRDGELRKVLTPEQWTKFEQLRQEPRGQRRPRPG